MVERIGVGNAPHLDVSTAATAAIQREQNSQNLLPVQAVPLLTAEQSHSVGAVYPNGDRLRLEPHPFRVHLSAERVDRILKGVLEKLISPQDTQNPFEMRAARMRPILTNYLDLREQLRHRISHATRA